MNRPAPDALRLFNCIETRFAPTEQTAASRCECGAALTHEDERDCGHCFDCLSEAAGCTNAEPFNLPILLPFLSMKGSA